MKNNSNRGFLSGILGTLLVIVGVAFYAVVSSLINRAFIGLRFGDDVACASLTLSGVGLTVAFVLYEIIFFTWQMRSTKKAAGNNAEIAKMSKILKIVAASCISLSLLFAVFSANTFVELRDDSISRVCFVTTKEYRWNERNDVLRYTFTCDAEGGLTYKITMKDGTVIDILGGTLSHSKSFGEKYDTAKLRLLDYAAHLSEEFDNCDFIIEKKISGIDNMERFYKSDFPDAWHEIERIIASNDQ